MVPFHDYKKWLNEGFRTRDAHVFEHFAKKDSIGKILVINRPTSVAEMLIKRKSWKTPEGMIEYKKNGVQLSKMSGNTWCLDILALDFFKVILQRKMWWFTAFNYGHVGKSINEAISYLNMTDAILLLQNPMAIGTVKALQYKYFVFDAIDNWLYHPQMPNKKLINTNYKFVSAHADLVTTVSQALLEIFQKNKNAYWVPNGVDIEYFRDAVKPIRKSHRIVGYIGKIQDRVDFNLVEKCLKNFPRTQFVFLGPVYSQHERISMLQKRYNNIIFKGDIHYSRLPIEMKAFDIAIIPHKVDLFTNSMNPLKLYEYLAAGKPVVTTGIAGTDFVSSYVRVCETAADFVEKLNDVLSEPVNSLDVVDSVPNECTWEHRTDVMIKMINALFTDSTAGDKEET